ncbi:MAG: D-xylose transporter permease, partial [Massilia sp.]|nr:D-xylose transporter permease [Massilia sp.]
MGCAWPRSAWCCSAFVRTLNSYEGIPLPVLLVLALLGIFSYVATQTVFGRRVYAV